MKFTVCYASLGIKVTTCVDSVTNHAEVSATVVVSSTSRHTSPQKAKSLGDVEALVTTPIDDYHVEVSAIVVVPSPSGHTSPRKAKSLGDVKTLLPDNDTLVLQNHFSSLDGLKTTDVGGDPHTGVPVIPTAIVDINYEHITIENQVASKFWANPNEMEEHGSDTGEETVRTKRKPWRPLKGIVKSKKLLR